MTWTVETPPDALPYLSHVSLDRVPRHVAIIMDGNRRWAQNRGVPIKVGHWKGAEVLIDTVKTAIDLGIKVLTVFAFSTENWNRSPAEVAMLLDLLKVYLEQKQSVMKESGIQLASIGDTSPFPASLKKVLDEAKETTKDCDKIQLVLALNYGGRDDLRRAFIRMGDAYKEGILQKEDLTEEMIASYLDTAPFGDPELLIRTSGEMRVSNFLLWQISYAEVYLTETFWPDFSRKDFFDALVAYQRRERRLGC